MIKNGLIERFNMVYVYYVVLFVKNFPIHHIYTGMIRKLKNDSYFIGTNPRATVAAHRLLLVKTQNKPQFEAYLQEKKPTKQSIHLILASKGSACKSGELKWFEQVLPTIDVTTIDDSHHSVHNAQLDAFATLLRDIARRAFGASDASD
jgi:hypothetical protein